MNTCNFKLLKNSSFVFIFLLMVCTAVAQTSPWEMHKRMGRGINIGNTMDAPTEGQWSAKVEEFYFDDFKQAGFTSVRLPVRWENHIQSEPPYTIDEDWLNRVEQVVDWSLERGLVTILNTHHDDWLYANFPDSLQKFEKLWEQVALRFKDKPDHLLFEIINEPYFDLTRSQVDTVHQTILPIIRVNNPTRITIITGGGNDTSPRLTNYRVFEHLILPDDPYLIAYFHYYSPFKFTHDDANNDAETWGTAAEKQTVDDNFDVVQKWSVDNNVPILLGEFGVDNVRDLAPRLAWYQYIVEGAVNRGFAFTVWDAGPQAGKHTYLRQADSWRAQQLNVITGQGIFTDTLAHVSGKIEAENFDTGGGAIAYFDADSLNSSGFYRLQEGVEIDSVNADNYSVLLDQAGEWLEYSMFVDSEGFYYLDFFAAALDEQKQLSFKFINGLGSQFVNIPNTGNLKQFATIRDSVYLNDGFQILRITAESGGVSLDKVLISLKEKNTEKNLLSNPDFELGSFDWVARNCTLTPINSPVQGGSGAILVSGRGEAWGGPMQTIDEQLQENGPGYYLVSAFARAIADTGVNAKISISLDYDGQKHFTGIAARIDTNGWTNISGRLLLNWNSPVDNAIFYVETVKGYTGDFYLDNVRLIPDSLLTEVESADNDLVIPADFHMVNWPNPFNPSTNISFLLEKPSQVRLVIYDILGREVNVLVDDFRPGGSYTMKWNGRAASGAQVSSGVYFARLQAGGNVAVNKMMLVR